MESQKGKSKEQDHVKARHKNPQTQPPNAAGILGPKYRNGLETEQNSWRELKKIESHYSRVYNA